MTPSEQATINRRVRLGMPVTPVKRIPRRLVPNVVAAAPPVEAIARPRPATQIPARSAHWSRIVQEVATKHNLDVASLLSDARFTHIVLARNEAFWRIRHEVMVLGAPMSLPQIGRRFNKDHSSVLHGIRKHQALIDAAEILVNPVKPTFAKRVGCLPDSMVRDSRPLFRNEAVE